ncbi:MAG: DUF362 domain-containing protein [Lachnospiraceae bacterium]|nr:DUF362 domain-containing protein [Lachnospiraceae bacterium]
MKSNELLMIYGTEYKEMAKQLLEAADLAGRIPDAGSRIGLKPNLVSPSEASWGATTHPEIVAGTIEYLKEHGFENLVILEGSWVGDKTAEAFEVCGYDRLVREYGVEFIDTQKDSFHTKDCAGMELEICDSVESLDFLINLPVLKGHCQTKITCALKNMKGLIPNREKRHFHGMGLHRPIAHLNVGIRQDFILVDNICGDLDFEDGGNPVVMNRLIAAVDPVLCDAYVCRMLNYETEEVPYLRMAEELGVGNADLSRLEIRALNEPEQETVVPGERKIVELQDAVEEVESCSACYGYLIPALDRLKQEGLLEQLDTRIAIGQGYQQKTGHLGIGRCTSCFEHSLKGCPPTEEQMYEFLKDYILRSGSEAQQFRRGNDDREPGMVT